MLVHNEFETQALAQALAPHLSAGDTLGLYGSLGTGKSSFARALIKSLCGQDTDVPSPTFTLLQAYEPLTGPPLWHWDLYRLETPQDVLELGIEEGFGDGISLIEWPERLGGLLPPNTLKITFRTTAFSPEAREVTFDYHGSSPKIWACLLGLS